MHTRAGTIRRMTSGTTAGLFRRLAAAVYDALVVAALCMLTTLIVLVFRGGEPVSPGNPLYQASLFATAAAFFVTFWVKGGQTVGMRAWRIRVERQSGGALSWQLGVARFIVGVLCLMPLGLGMLWLQIDRDRLTWYDRLTKTRVIIVPKPAPAGR